MKKNLSFIVTIAFLGCFNFLSPISFGQNYPTGFSQEKVASVNNATSMAFAPDGRLFVTEQQGKVRVIKNGSLLSTSFVQLNVTTSGGERGLHSVAFDPDFVNNNYVYFYYSVNANPTFCRLERYTANGDVALSGSAVTIMEFEKRIDDIHHGGGIGFGPDGKMFLAIGEDNQPAEAQDTSNYLGTLIRINRDGSAPADNPLTGSEVKKRLWAYGFRNPYTLAIQPGTGRIFVNDVGGSKFEEINNATTPILNFGWPVKEGMSSDPAYANPIYAYPHGSGNNKGCAITGGDFFNPGITNYPAIYYGKYFFTDYCNGWINYINPDVSAPVEQNFATGLSQNRVYLKTGPDGNLYYIARGDVDAVFRIIYTQNESPVITQHPQSQMINGGQTATFEVSVSGSTPFSYQWRKNGTIIPDADSSAYIIENVTSSDEGDYTVRVTNAHGSATSNIATLTVESNNTAPMAFILLPATGTFYSGGDTIFFEGNGTDSEEGSLSGSAFTWTVEFHHDNHFHPGPMAPQGVKTGFFLADTLGETSPNVFYQLILEVTDSAGASNSSFVDILPRTSTINLLSVPSGLQLKLDAQPQTTAFSVMGVEGLVRSISAPSPQTLNGITYTFDHWEHGGSQAQSFRVAEKDTTFIAIYNEAIVSNEELIPLNAEWKYLDNGSNQGTAWSAVGFDDSGWSSGNAELGYGDGDETTVVNFGPSSSSKYITTYFRKNFNITDASSFTDLELQLLRDDGAVVYLNGTEVYRSNMLSGNISYTTLASSGVSGSGEDAFFPSPVNPSLLVDGENVVAVEIHQRSGGSSDISFNFSLNGNKVESTTCEPPTSLSATNITISSATLQWNTASLATAYNVEYKETTASVWLQENTTATSLNISGLSANTNYEFKVQTVCADSTSDFSPAFSFTTLTPLTGGDTIAEELISINAEWKYLDNGSNQGAAWSAVGFDDSFWVSGNAELGYGDGDEATVVSFGSSSSSKYITTYFRKSFNIANASSFTDLELQLLRDDGAVVYLNGTEVYRSNMPSGTISFTTLASSGVSGSGEDAFFSSPVNPSLLIDGENVIAVEIHQKSGGSSDISFNFSLNGNRVESNTCQPPTSLSATNITTSAATLQWNAASLATAYNVEYKETSASSWIQKNTSATSLNISGLSPNTNYEFKVQTICSDSSSGFSQGFSFTTLTPSTGGDTISEELIPINAQWKYLDNGSNQGIAWRAIGFNDSGWASGNAELGYGDGDEATVVSFGSSSSSKYITTYFRKSFNIANASSSYMDLELQLLRDDGAVVYLNGTEVYRNNMPSGTISFTTLASSGVSGSGEDAFFSSPVNPSLLVDGENVIAVEIHQNYGKSSDISFNLRLNGSGITNKNFPSELNAEITSEENIPEELGLKVFPNPTTGMVNIIYKGKVQGEVKFRVTNFNGQTLVEETYSDFKGEMSTTINLGKNAKGIYFLEITNGDVTIIEKLLLD